MLFSKVTDKSSVILSVRRWLFWPKAHKWFSRSLYRCLGLLWWPRIRNHRPQKHLSAKFYPHQVTFHILVHHIGFTILILAIATWFVISDPKNIGIPSCTRKYQVEVNLGMKRLHDFLHQTAMGSFIDFK